MDYCPILGVGNRGKGEKNIPRPLEIAITSTADKGDSNVVESSALTGMLSVQPVGQSQYPIVSEDNHIEPTSMTMPSNIDPDDYLKVVAHPKFEEVAREIFIGRQIGEDREKQQRIAEQFQQTIQSIHRARQKMQKQSSNPDLDLLLSKYLKLVQGLNHELVLTQSEANTACTMFEQQIRTITQSASQMEGPVALSATDEDHLKQVLKRKYSSQIQQLNEEFRRKRKKGKLPINATDVLRRWWDNNLAWPYPSEDEKRALADETDLSPTQINNWFINQRKRHWHKFFKDGKLPQSPEEAVEILKAQGVLP